MKRAFAKVGSARFLADSDDPTVIYAEEECAALIGDRSYWHSAGVVPVSDVRRAVQFGIQIQWRVKQAGGCYAGVHSVRLTADELRLVLVALDQALEKGLPPRCAFDVKKARAA